MRYEFVDIGTSFFCASVDDYGLDVNGLLVEPIKEYLAALPSSSTVKKANYAVSDSNRKDVMFSRATIGQVRYVSKTELDKIRATNQNVYDIGIRGCSSLGDHHPQGGMTAQTTTCDVITFTKLCELYDITEIGQLKIDTEGHEHKILPQVLDLIRSGQLTVTERIIFEYNTPQNEPVLDQLTAEFEKCGFVSELFDDHFWNRDIILTKKA